VFLAGTAQDARQLCARHPAIDVVLTDVVMAGDSGPELTGRRGPHQHRV